MNDINPAQDELRKIQQAIHAQEALRGLGVLTDEQVEATLAVLREKERAYLAHLHGSGAVVQGDHSIGLGQEAQYVGASVQGDVLGPGARKENHYHGSIESDPDALRSAYLNRLLVKSSYLFLSGIDPKVATEARARLSLSAIYTALNVYAFDKQFLSDLPPREVRILQLRYGLLDGQIYSLEEVARKMGVSPTVVGKEELGALSRLRIPVLSALNDSDRLVLLGDPGSGKTTFINFVVLCLAGQVLGRQDANMTLLTAPLPQEEEPIRSNKPKNSQPQPWDHGALLPLRVILRDFAARGLPEESQFASASHLWRFIAAELEAASLSDFAPILQRELIEKGGLLLLDGLDEVPEAGRRRVQIKAVVEDFAASFPKVRILVTSRTYAYLRQDWCLQGFTQAILSSFSEVQIRQFVDRWYAHISLLRNLDKSDARGRAELLKRAIFSSDRLLGLAERPLLLTLMASLHAWRGGSLPEKREELYNDTVELLLDWWESPKVVRDAKGGVLVSQPSLAEWLKVDRQKVRNLLNELAFQAHSAQTELFGTADIPEGNLVSGLLHLSQNPEVSANPTLLVDYLSQRAGLLLSHGVGVYTFPHRTFQEYLAACYLTDHDFPELIADLVCGEFNRWREIALLAGAKAARGTSSAFWMLVDALCYTEPDGVKPKPKQQWGAHLAGQAIAESANLANLSERNRPKIERVRRWLVNILKIGTLPTLERIRIGETLAQLGDLRFDPKTWYLPDESLLGFVEIPAGSFRMGSDPNLDKNASKREQPQHEVFLPTYYISRYPVIVAQYKVFIQKRGYQPADDFALRSLSNHPVEVGWYDSLEYCRWLEEKLRQMAENKIINKPGLEAERNFWEGLANGKLKVSLPSEAEWEKAARGLDGRIYSWGSKFDPDKANFLETGLGRTSPVGCFPSGASPYGLLDMSGNVWEWTRSIWGRDGHEPEFKYPYVIGDERENLKAPRDICRVLRGGSFMSDAGYSRCANRPRLNLDYGGNGVGFRVVVSPSDSAL